MKPSTDIKMRQEVAACARFAFKNRTGIEIGCGAKANLQLPNKLPTATVGTWTPLPRSVLLRTHTDSHTHTQTENTLTNALSTYMTILTGYASWGERGRSSVCYLAFSRQNSTEKYTHCNFLFGHPRHRPGPVVQQFDVNIVLVRAKVLSKFIGST